MKHLIFCLFLSSITAFAQDFSTNAKGSSYSFKPIVKLDATPVLNQGNSGTCWSFSGMSFFESELLRMGKPQIVLSEMYMVRKAYEKKAEMYVRLDGKTNFGQGGEFHDIPAIIGEFGVLPQEVYPGLNYGNEKHDHSEMYEFLKGAMDGLIAHMNSRRFDGLTEAWSHAVGGILDAYLGPDVTSFTYNGKSFTPSYFAKYLGLEMDNYVSLTSFTHQPLYAPFQLEIPDNWSRKAAYNVDLDEMYAAVLNALEEGYTVGWTADVSEPGFSHKMGLAVLPVDPDTLKANTKSGFMTPVPEIDVTPVLRQKGYDNKTTQDDHLMHIVGSYEDQNGTNYFLVKNSWGTSNYPEGYLFVSASYFKMKTIYVYMHKGCLQEKLRKKLPL